MMSRYDTMEIGHMRSLKEQPAPHIPSKPKRELNLLSFPELRSKKGICYSREHVCQRRFDFGQKPTV
jgi:hypothetical protein